MSMSMSMSKTKKPSLGRAALLVMGTAIASCATASERGTPGHTPIDCQASCATTHDSCMNHHSPLTNDADPASMSTPDGKAGATDNSEMTNAGCNAAFQDCLGSCHS